MSSNGYAQRTATDTVRLERLLPGPIERVWAYLTESDKRATWLAAGEMELHVDGRVEHRFRNSTLTGHDDDAPPPKYANLACEVGMHGRITVCEPPTVLAYTWGEADGEFSEVRFDLSPVGDQVRLRVEHRRLCAGEQMLSVAAGWHTHLDILVDRLGGHAPAPFWSTHSRLEADYEQRL